MCVHLRRDLDRLIPNQSVSTRNNCVPWIDSVGKIEEANDLATQRMEMLNKLKWHALPQIYIDVLLYRFVHNWTLDSIAEKLAIPNRQTVFYIYKKALALLKERGYK